LSKLIIYFSCSSIFTAICIVFLTSVTLQGQTQKVIPQNLQLVLEKTFLKIQKNNFYSVSIDASEYYKFDKVPHLIQKRMSRIEGVNEDLYYATQTTSKVFFKGPNQYLYKIQDSRVLNRPVNDPVLLINPDFFQEQVGGCPSPFYKRNRKHYIYQKLSSDNQLLRFTIKPKHERERLFSGEIEIDTSLQIITKFHFTTVVDGVNYSFEVENEKNQNAAPKKIKVQLGGKGYGFRGKYFYECNFANYNFGVETRIGNLKSIPPSLNIQDINFEITQLRQVARVLHKSLRKDWLDDESNSRSDVIIGFDFPKIDSLTKEIKFDSVDSQMVTRIFPFTKADSTVQLTKPDTFRIINFSPEQMIFSKSFFLGKKRGEVYPWEIYYRSPVFDTNYNTAEGLVSNLGFYVRRRWGLYKWIEFDATGRRSFGLGTNSGILRLRFKDENNILDLNGGQYFAQYNYEQPISPEMNSLSTLLLKNNIMKIYDRKFINFSLVKRFSGTLVFKSSLEFAERIPMQNSFGYYFIDYFKRTYTSNYPNNLEKGNTGFDPHKAFTYLLQFNFRPRLGDYALTNEKIMHWENSPLLMFKLRGGLPILGSAIDFTHLEFSLIQQKKLSPWTQAGLIVNTGVFLNTKKMEFIDFKHFNGNTTLLMQSDILASHRLIGLYSGLTNGANQRLIDHYLYSTSGNYLEIMGYMRFDKFFLNRFDWLKKTKIKEVISLNYLRVNNQKLNYLELGYGWDGIYKIFRAEIFTSFINAQYNTFGLRINVNSRLRIGNIPEL
jgi:Family of unknown function (DUF5686)